MKHKEVDMIDVTIKYCQFIDCKSRAKFNFYGEKIRLFCNDHKQPLMIDLTQNYCKVKGCQSRYDFS